LLHLVGIISLLSMMHGTTNIKFIDIRVQQFIWDNVGKGNKVVPLHTENT